MLRRYRTFRWGALVITIVCLQWMQTTPENIEQLYARRAYPPIGRFLRKLTGWLPFSLGDVLYSLVVLAGMLFLIHLFKKARNGALGRAQLIRIGLSALFLTACIYLLFNILWGMNYERQGIASQLGLQEETPSDSSLVRLVRHLRDRTNGLRPRTLPDGMVDIDQIPQRGYKRLSEKWPLPEPGPFSLKTSLFGGIGNYLGYSGYFNPFTGEAQVNATIPVYMLPFVACHEVAHQLGYAREHEASFVGHLAARASEDTFTQYSSYLNMFLYAQRELRMVDSVASRTLWDGVSPAVQADIRDYRMFLKQHDTWIGTWVDLFYDRYLKWNDQPEGVRTYSRVVIWLSAWLEKYGDV